MSRRTHVSRTVSSCFAALRQIKSMQRSVSQPVLLSLISSLVLARLDYGSIVLTGISDSAHGPFTVSAQRCSKTDLQPSSTTVSLRCLKNCIGSTSQNALNFDWPFLCLSAVTRQHLSIWLTICSGPQMTARERDFAQRRSTNSSCAGRDYQRLETAPSASPHLAYGTVCVTSANTLNFNFQETFENTPV